MCHQHVRSGDVRPVQGLLGNGAESVTVVASHATDRRYPASATTPALIATAGPPTNSGGVQETEPHGPKDLPVGDASELDRYL